MITGVNGVFSIIDMQNLFIVSSIPFNFGLQKPCILKISIRSIFVTSRVDLISSNIIFFNTSILSSSSNISVYNNLLPLFLS